MARPQFSNSRGIKQPVERSSKTSPKPKPRKAAKATKVKATKAEKNLRAKPVAKRREKPTENKRPVQHRKQSPNEASQLDKLKVAHTPLSIAFRHIEPTWRNYIYFANQAATGGDEAMVKFIETYNALPKKEQNSIMPDQVCSLSGVAPGDLIAAVSREVWLHHAPESVIAASVNHPKMVLSTAFFGQSYPDNNKDRELFFRLTGGLPDKKGSSIVINNNPQTANINSPAPAAANGFKAMDQRVIEMGKFLDAPESSLAVPMFSKEPALVLAEDDTSED